MKTVDIKIPGSLADYTIHEVTRVFPLLLKEVDKGKELLHKIDIIHALTLIEIPLLRRCDAFKINVAYQTILKQFNRKITPPKKEIKLNGVVYCFEQDISSKTWEAGRFIDADNVSIDVMTEPETLCAICYIEKGKNYEDVPLEKRAEIMKNHMPGDNFLDMYAFFLRKYNQLHEGFLILNIAKAIRKREEAAKLMRQSG